MRNNGLNIRINRQTIKLPNLMKYALLYLSGTVFMFFFGPITWKVKNPGIILFYLILYNVALGFGYWIGIRRVRTKEENKPVSCHNLSKTGSQRITQLLVLGIFFDILMIIRMANTLNISEILSKMINGLVAPAMQYSIYFQEATAGNLYGGSIFSLFITLGAPICVAGIILAVFFYKDLSASSKVACWILVTLHFGSKLISSANEGIFDLAIYIGVSVYMRAINENLTSKRGNISKKWRMLLVIVLGIILVGIALTYFKNNIMGRTLGNFTFGTLGENYYDPNSGINKYIPEPLFIVFVYLIAYLCQGYYGFSLSTLVDWVPMFGMGFSSFLRRNVSDILGVDLFELSYQKRIESVANWGGLKNFHSAYTFWANDVTRFGVIFVMFFIGYKFSSYYHDCVVKCKMTSIVMMPLMVTLILYLPMNNKIFVQPTSFLLIMYIFLINFYNKHKHRR